MARRQKARSTVPSRENRRRNDYNETRGSLLVAKSYFNKSVTTGVPDEGFLYRVKEALEHKLITVDDPEFLDVMPHLSAQTTSPMSHRRSKQTSRQTRQPASKTSPKTNRTKSQHHAIDVPWIAKQKQGETAKRPVRRTPSVNQKHIDEDEDITPGGDGDEDEDITPGGDDDDFQDIEDIVRRAPTVQTEQCKRRASGRKDKA